MHPQLKLVALDSSTLHSLHSFMRKDLKLSVFMHNLYSLAWYGSYQVWISREEPQFATPPFLLPHIAELPPVIHRLPAGLAARARAICPHLLLVLDQVLFWASTAIWMPQ